MAAGEDQAEPFVGQGRLLVVALQLREPLQELGLSLERSLSPYSVYRSVARRREEPGGRAIGDALEGPPLDRRCDRVLEGVLGELEVAEDADQVREDAAPLLAEDALDRGQCSITGRTSIAPPVRAAGIRAAISTASSRLSHSTR
jgi:hypothetical protein